MSDIFLSYSRTDEERVRPLAAALEVAGFSVWWDRNLSGGERFSRETEAQLNAAKAIVVVWSAASVQSMWVADEATVGRDKGNLIPVSIDGAAPPIGFRQIQTILFDHWRGEAAAPCLETLKRALARAIDPSTPAAAAPAPAAVPRTKRRAVVIATIGGAALSITLVAFLIGGQSTREDADAIREAAAEVTRDLAQSAAADEREVRLAGDAVSAIGASREPEAKSAFARLVAGDSIEAVQILDTLAERLEARGDDEAAAAVYTQIGALALLIDPGRALAARKRAFLLAPESMQAMQGLFFDTYLMQGGDAARAYADEAMARPGLSDRMRAFITAFYAIIAVDTDGDVEAARKFQAKFEEIERRTRDPYLAPIALWLEALIAELVDDLSRAETAADKSMELTRSLPADVPRNGEVMKARILYRQGDWAESFRFAAAALDRRRGDGDFIPMPMLAAACNSAVFLGRIGEGESYCLPLAGWTNATGGAEARAYAGLIAAARGDFEKANAEFRAADALRNRNDAGGLITHRVFEAYALGKAGDLDGAEKLLREAAAFSVENQSTRSKNRSFRANAWHMFGATAIGKGEAARACAPLAEAGALYAEIGGEAGVRETERLRAEAACTE